MQVGWQGAPSRRGTINILENCLFTIFACTWSVLHLNIPGPKDATTTKYRRKFWATVLALLLPEYMLALAIAERQYAIDSLENLRQKNILDIVTCFQPWWRQLWKALKSLWIGVQSSVTTYIRRLARGRQPPNTEVATELHGNPGATRVNETASRTKARWTLTHAYYLNMGGLRLGARENLQSICNLLGESHLSIPLNCTQFGYLRSIATPEGYIETPDLSEDEIKDKSKTDDFTKAIALVQLLWLFVSLVVRAKRHLATSQLEILAVAYAGCAFLTFCFSWDKPQNVETATYLYADRPLTTQETRRIIQLQSKELVSLLAGNADIRRSANLNRIHNGSVRFSKNLLQPVTMWLALSIFTFGAVHLSAWDFTFPTRAEEIMWKICGIITMILPLAPLVLNAAISVSMTNIQDEVLRFEDQMISLWEQYLWTLDPAEVACLPPGLNANFLTDLLFEMRGWLDREQKFQKFEDYVSTLGEGLSDFEYFKIHLLGPTFELVRELNYRNLPRKLRERDPRPLSTLEKIGLNYRLGEHTLAYTFGIYVAARLLMIILAFISLRSAPDGMYIATWAKNLPSLQ